MVAKILLIRMSSMGDLIHTLPVISDIHQHYPEAQIDWVAEEAFAAIPSFHPCVNTIIPIAWRRWRRQLLQRQAWRQMAAFKAQLQAQHYDAVIDTQGLLKSALVGKMARGPLYGMNSACVRERLALPFYDTCLAVPKGLHVVQRNRVIAGMALGYTPDTPVHYGLKALACAPDWQPQQPYAVCLTATARAAKEWPEAHWVSIAQRLHQQGLQTIWPWGSAAERARCQRIVAALGAGLIAPARLDLTQAAGLMQQAKLVLGVDTGLTHLGNAMETPTVAIFCDSLPSHAGVMNRRYAVNLGGLQQHPTVDAVWRAVEQGLQA